MSITGLTVAINEEHRGNIYLEAKNTFLEFYTTEMKQIKNGARQRSFSADCVRTRADSQSLTEQETLPDTPCSDRSLHSIPSGILSSPFSPSSRSWKTGNTGTTRASSPSSHSIDSAPTSCGKTGNSSSTAAYTPSASTPGTPTWNRRQNACQTCSTRESSPCPSLDSHDHPHDRMPFPSLYTQDHWMPEMPELPEMQEMPIVPMAMPMVQVVVVQQPGWSPDKSHWLESKKKKDLKKLNPPPTNYAGITTLMIRGIPCKFSQDDLFQVVASAGLADSCDFFYMPTARNGANFGYAFINFTETIHAWTCAFTFDGLRLDPERSAKICTVSPADIQGIANLRKHFKRSLVSRGPDGPIWISRREKGTQGPCKAEKSQKSHRKFAGIC